MKKVLITLAALALSGTAMAGPSWTYVDLGYVTGDSGDETTDGLALRGSFGFGSLWHIQADVVTSEANGGKGTTGGSDNTGYVLRGGIHPAVTDNTDFVLDVAYSATEVDDGSGGSTPEPNSIDLRTGVRSNIGQLELRSFVTLAFGDTDLGGGATDFRSVNYTVGGQYNFNDAWSVGTDATVGNSSASNGGTGDLLNLYVRWSF